MLTRLMDRIYGVDRAMQRYRESRFVYFRTIDILDDCVKYPLDPNRYGYRLPLPEHLRDDNS